MLYKDLFSRFGSHKCQCSCDCTMMVNSESAKKCHYCKSGNCPAGTCDKCGGSGYIWNSEKQESKPCKCKTHHASVSIEKDTKFRPGSTVALIVSGPHDEVLEWWQEYILQYPPVAYGTKGSIIEETPEGDVKASITRWHTTGD